MWYESRRKFFMKLFVTMVDSIVLLSWIKGTSNYSLRSLAQCVVNCPFVAIFVDFVIYVCVCVCVYVCVCVFVCVGVGGYVLDRFV